MYQILILALLTIATAGEFWAPCTDHPNALIPTRVESSVCSGNLCTVQRGEDLIADVDIIFAGVHKRLDINVTAYISGLAVHLPQSPPDDDACSAMYRDGSLVGCPTVANAHHIWKIKFFLPKAYPAFSNSRVRFELLDEGKVELCTVVTATMM